MNPRFDIDFRWLASDLPDERERATLAEITIDVGGLCATEVEDIPARTIRSSARLPAVRLAELAGPQLVADPLGTPWGQPILEVQPSGCQRRRRIRVARPLLQQRLGFGPGELPAHSQACDGAGPLYQPLHHTGPHSRIHPGHRCLPRRGHWETHHDFRGRIRPAPSLGRPDAGTPRTPDICVVAAAGGVHGLRPGRSS